jgi:hypothetical protein
VEQWVSVQSRQDARQTIRFGGFLCLQQLLTRFDQESS